MGMQDAYSYQLDLEWTGRRAGKLQGLGLPALWVSAPREFSGEDGVWTPEHLLVGATASCLMTTFLAIAEISKLTVLSYRCKASGKLEKISGAGYSFTEIVLAPEVAVPGGDEQKALRLLAKAEGNCFVAKSLRTVVRLEPQIVGAEAEVVR